MKINKLFIKSFGKFQNKEINLKQGINLIVGDNEAGKSTIHKFIEGMFYGFYRPNIKRRMTTEEYDKYLPWDNSNEYYGVMEISEEDKEIRIERNFMKGKDELTIYDNNSGEDISSKYEYDSVLKLHNYAKEHLGINYSTFKNTVSISQMESKTSEELVKEIKDNIINLGETKNLDISINNIIKKIQEKKDDIGTEKRKTSNYGRLKQRIKEIEKEKEEAITNWEAEKELKDEENLLLNNLNSLLKLKEKIEEKMKYYKAEEYKKKYIDATKVIKQINDLEEELNSKAIYKDVNKDEINNSLNLIQEVQLLIKSKEEKEDRIKDLNRELRKTKNELNEIDVNSQETISIDKINSDIYKYEDCENKKREIDIEIRNCREEDKDNYNKLISKNKIIKLFLLTDIGLIMASIIALFMGVSFGVASTVITIVVLIMVGFIYNTNSKLIKKLEKLIIIQEEKKETLQNELEEIIKIQKEIMDNYNVQNIYELRAIKESLFKKKITNEENIKQYNKLKIKEKELNDKIETIKKNSNIEIDTINTYKNKVNKTLDKYMATDESGLKRALELHYDYIRVNQELINKKELLDKIVGGETIENIKNKADVLNETDIPIEETSYDELINKLKEVNESILNINREVSMINTKIEHIEANNRKLVDIEEELFNQNEKIEKMDFKINSLTLVEEAIEHISKELQNNFAPKLNERISAVIKKVTNNKYSEIKVNPNMEISIVDNNINRLVKAEDLSSGTIDLMYFALRMGISDIVSEGKNIPLILDDCFVQYDYKRLNQVIQLLSNQDKQIIIFTCHKREEEILKDIMDKVNLVIL